MNRGKAIFSQLLAQVPFSHFEHLVDVYQTNKGVRHFSVWNHFLCLMYAQQTRRSGLRGPATRSTLADANERRDYRLFEALGQRLIANALALYQNEDLGLGLKGSVYALDSTTIDLCLSLFPWAEFRQTKAAVKAHVLLDLRAAIPVFVSLTTGKVHDVRILDQLSLPMGSMLVADQAYPDPLRRIAFIDPESAKELVLLTNRFDLAATTIASLTAGPAASD